MKYFLLSLTLLLTLSGCSNTTNLEPYEYVIGVSLSNMSDPWKLALMEELEAEASNYKNINLVFRDATSDSSKQINDINLLSQSDIDLMIISPTDSEIITPVIEEIYENIPVIILDRVVEGYSYSLFIGPDNRLIGSQAAEAARSLSGDSHMNILEISGVSLSSEEKHIGFSETLNGNSTIKTVKIKNETKDGAKQVVLASDLTDINLIFAHNDYMAEGVSIALDELGLSSIKIIGVDGFDTENDGLDMIENDIIDATIACSTGGKEAVINAINILNNTKGVPKQIILRSNIVYDENVESFRETLREEPVPYEEKIHIGHVIIGNESGWREANNKSIEDAAREFSMKYSAINSNQSMEKQIEAIDYFIEQKVDVIVLSPVVSDGWDEVLGRAKDAGIPVLLSDRKINTETTDLYDTFIGADFIEQGRRAMRWVIDNVDGENVKILEIRGTKGASPTIERGNGFREILETNDNYSIVYEGEADYSKETGAKVISDYLETYETFDIDVIFAHNDDMAIGAIEVLEANGITPGIDVKIVSVDGTKEALTELKQGAISCVVECNPLLGPELMKAVSDLMNGEELPLRIITDEIVFTDETEDIYFEDRKY